MDITDFLPNYPPIPELSNEDDFYSNLFDENISFNQLIFQKKEFYDLKLSSIPDILPEPGDHLRHQEIISRFLSSFTLYDELLLFWEAGSGKSCSAVATIEQNIRSSNSTIKKAIIITKNKEMVKKFIEEIIYVCNPPDRYRPEELDDDRLLPPLERQKQINRRAKQNISPYYTLYTHEQFYNHILVNLPLEKQKELYSNRIIVIDEVHNLTDSVMYEKYHAFLHVVQNRKILLMTGTPMRNNGYEIATLMNLILPLHMQLPMQNEFNKLLSDDNRTISPEGVDLLMKRFTGRVSFLKTSLDVVKDFIGTKVYPVTKINLYPSKMSDFQKLHYKNVLNNDTGFYLETQQASLFVFPDGSVGNKGFNKYVVQNNNNFKFSSAMSNIFLRTTTQERLQIISLYSTKYAKIIKHILDNPNQNVFVFNESIKGGGAIVFGLCLGLFGFSNMTQNIKGKGKRYAILSDISEKSSVRQVLDVFNRKTNKHGDYLRVLIGGRKVAEGLTFRNIQQIHICSPHWNFSVLDQAIARGVRAFSHRDLLVDNSEILVKIYLHVAMFDQTDKNWMSNIDVRIYKEAEDKDIIIKQIEYLLKVNAFDCPLTWDRNTSAVANVSDYSRDCEYQKCDYKCSGVDVFPYTLSRDQLDQNTYALYYFNKETEVCLKIIEQLFQSHTALYLYEIYDVLKETIPYLTWFECCRILKNIINKPFKNRYNQTSFLHEENNCFYITNTAIRDTTYLTSYYNEFPVSQSNVPIKNIIYQEQLKQMPELINKICALPFENFKIAFMQLPINLQQMFLEYSISYKHIQTDKIQWILDAYSNYIIVQQPLIFVILVKDNPRVLTEDGTWKNANPNQIQQQTFDTPYYGRMIGKKFYIINNTDEKAKAKGKICSSYVKEELEFIITTMKMTSEHDVEFIKNLSKKKCCEIIYNWFNQNNLIEYK